MNQHSTRRDLILAVLHQRSFASVAPFLNSLNGTGFQGRLVMFTSRVGAETDARLLDKNVTALPFHFSGKRDRQRLARLWPLWGW